jgi:hypothetical protein
MIVSDKPIEAGFTFLLVIKLPEPLKGRTTIELEARSLWSRPAPNPRPQGTGFEITRSRIRRTG